MSVSLTKPVFTITTAHTSNASGRSQVVAKGHGKQRTVSVDFSKSNDYNDGAAVGTLLDVLLNDEQKAKLRHPSAKQRVRVESISEAGGKKRWTITV